MRKESAKTARWTACMDRSVLEKNGERIYTFNIWKVLETIDSGDVNVRKPVAKGAHVTWTIIAGAFLMLQACSISSVEDWHLYYVDAFTSECKVMKMVNTQCWPGQPENPLCAGLTQQPVKWSTGPLAIRKWRVSINKPGLIWLCSNRSICFLCCVVLFFTLTAIGARFEWKHGTTITAAAAATDNVHQTNWFSMKV